MGKLIDDDTNKLVVFANTIVFGYTGLAFIDRKQLEPTDWWLTQRLSELSTKSLSDAVIHVRDQATEAFQRLPNNASYTVITKRHAFVGIGWQEQEDKTLLPIIVRISNFHDEQTILSAAKDHFEAYAEVYSSPGFGLCYTGANVTPEEWADVNRLINRCGKKGTGFNPVIRHFVSAIRKIAARDRTVGKNLLAVAMPKGAILADNPAVFSPNGFGVVTGLSEGPPPFPPGGPGPSHSVTSLYLPNGNQRLDYLVNIAYPGVAIEAVKSGPVSLLMADLIQSEKKLVTVQKIRV